MAMKLYHVNKIWYASEREFVAWSTSGRVGFEIDDDEFINDHSTFEVMNVVYSSIIKAWFIVNGNGEEIKHGQTIEKWVLVDVKTDRQYEDYKGYSKTSPTWDKLRIKGDIKLKIL